MKMLIKSDLLLIKDIFFLLILIKLINLDNDNNFDDDDDPITVIYVRLLAWRSKFKKRKALKKKDKQIVNARSVAS